MDLKKVNTYTPSNMIAYLAQTQIGHAQRRLTRDVHNNMRLVSYYALKRVNSVCTQYCKQVLPLYAFSIQANRFRNAKPKTKIVTR